MIIYKTTCLINGKIYVGQDSKNNPDYLGSGIYLNRAIKKHGKENFKKEVVCECSSQEDLNKKEIYWIKELNSKVPFGYNITNGGKGSLGVKPNNETKQKMRISQHNRFLNNDYKNKFLKIMNSPQVKEKMKKPKSEEHKNKIKEKMRNQEFRKIHSTIVKESVNRPEVIENRIKAMNTPEYIEKMHKSKSKFHCRRISEGKTGVKRGPNSKEANLNIKLAQQKRRENEKERKITNGFVYG